MDVSQDPPSPVFYRQSPGQHERHEAYCLQELTQRRVGAPKGQLGPTDQVSGRKTRRNSFETKARQAGSLLWDKLARSSQYSGGVILVASTATI